jgi:hypothetical protein
MGQLVSGTPPPSGCAVFGGRSRFRWGVYQVALRFRPTPGHKAWEAPSGEVKHAASEKFFSACTVTTPLG